jgi:hypothetical protein
LPQGLPDITLRDGGVAAISRQSQVGRALRQGQIGPGMPMFAFREDNERSNCRHSIRSYALLVFELFEFGRDIRLFASAGWTFRFLDSVFLNLVEIIAVVLGKVAAISSDRIEDASALAAELRRNPIILSNGKPMAGA